MAAAVSSAPPTIAPAWPILLPAGAVCPAINPTTGFFEFFLIQYAASASIFPPISPIITMPSVSSSFIKNSTASLVVVPIIGSPPIPIAVEIPNPAFATWSAAS